MRYNKIRKMDSSNGPGVRVSIFMQGCSFHCKNCFNPETHDFNKGEEFTYSTINKILEMGVEVAIVVGGGNFWRGKYGTQMERTTSDYMGMLATTINGLAL